MNYKIERRTINRADVVLVYQFDDHSTDKPYGVDTWISLQNWNSIYEHIETLVDPSALSASSQQAVQEESFDLGDTPFTCYISWSPMTSALGQSITPLIAHSMSATNPYERATYLNIRVRKSINSKFTNQIKSLEKEIIELKRKLKRSSSSSKTSSSTKRPSSRLSGSSKAYKPHSQKQVGKSKVESTPETLAHETHEEYVPNAVATASKPVVDIQYQPGKVPDTVDTKHVEQYVPPKVSPVSAASTARYIPSSSNTKPPTATSNGQKHKHQHRTPKDSDQPIVESRRSKRSATLERKRAHSPDLFDTDDDTQATDERVTNRPHRKLKHVKERPDIEGNGKSMKRPTTARTAKISSKTTSSIASTANSEASSNLLSAEEFKTFMDTKDQAIVELAKLKLLMKSEELPDIEIVSLKHLAMDEIERKFEEHRPMLSQIFDQFCQEKDYNVKRPPDVSEFCCNYLFDNDQQVKMIEMLTNSFGGAEKLTVYYDLFWKLMMPEWSLQMFMSMYKFSRAEATERMRIQEKITAAQFPMEDTLGFGDDDSFLSVKKRR